MSFQRKVNRNASQRLPNTNNTLILDAIKGLDSKYNYYPNAIYHNPQNKNELQDKNTLLTITGKQVLNQNNNFIRTNNKQNTRQQTQLKKNIRQMKLILEQPLQSQEKRQCFIGINKQKKQNLLIVQQQVLNYKSEKNIFQKSKPRQFMTQALVMQKNLYQPIRQDKFFNQLSQSKEQAQNQRNYQQAIINDPVLYQEVVTAYKSFKRSINIHQKQIQHKEKKYVSVNKTSDKQRQPLKNRNPDNDLKNDMERKKQLNFNLYRQFAFIINLSNQICYLPEPEVQYKAFIEKGNNGLLIKSIVKTRPWWSIRTDHQNCNLIWTQWKKPKYMKILKDGETFQKSIEQQQVNSKSYNQLKDQKKHNLLNSLLSQSSLKKHANKLTTVSEQQVTKLHKKISDPSVCVLIQKHFPILQTKVVQKGSLIINHIPGCFQLHSKKLLYANMRKYYRKKNLNVGDYLPQTYVISKGLNDPQYLNFLSSWQGHVLNKNHKNIWICKPGQNSNRGHGITVVSTLNEIKSFITSHSSSNGMCSALIQKYMQNPFLYNKRKFDLRCYILITNVNGVTKGYWYEEGYIRTTSKEFSLKNIQNKLVHLTNDAIQKKGDNYGKFQSCNKVSYPQFEKYLEQNAQYKNLNFKETLAKMKQLATDLIYSVSKKINPQTKQFCFELFGLDFMLDDKLQPYIIQANSNPCIEVSGNVLGRIIPSLLQNVIRIAIDPIFPPPFSQNFKTTKYSPGNAFEQNKFQLVYDSLESNTNGEEYVPLTKEEEEEERMCEAEIENQMHDN